MLKIYRAAKEPAGDAALPPVGTVLSDGKTWLKVALSDGYLRLETLQLAGKKRMDAADFLRGFHLDGSERCL